MRKFLIALLLTAGGASADTEILLSADLYPVRLTTSADGSLWYAAYREGQNVSERVEVGRVLPTGVVEKVAFPNFYMSDIHAALVPAPDGGVIVAGASSKIVKIDARMSVTYLSAQNEIRSISDMTYGPDGNLWFVGTNISDAPVVGRMTPEGSEIQQFPLPGGSRAIASAPDGNLYVLTYNGIHRVTTSGAVTLAFACSCESRWLEVASDGTLWSAKARMLPNGSFIAHYLSDVRDGVEDANGKMWLAVRRANELQVRSSHGDLERVVPFAEANREPLAVTSSGDVIWYGARGAIRSFDATTRINLRLRTGDLVAIEPEWYYGISGYYPVLAMHHRGARPFSRRPLNWRENFRTPSGVFALNASRILVQYDDDGTCTDCPLATIMDSEGVVRAELQGPPKTIGAGIFVDRAGRIRSLRMMNDSGEYRMLTYAATGHLLSNIPVPIPQDEIDAVELASDQCTLYYGYFNKIERVDICTGAVLPDFARDLPGYAYDLRILPNGDVLAVSASRLVRFNSNGAIVRQYEAVTDAQSIALDPDPNYIWIGTRELQRMHLASGEIVERIAAFNSLPVWSISVIGEPRAARMPVRRHSVRR